MKAVIFSGTTEGRQLSLALAAEGIDVVVSVASEVGAEEQGSAEGITVAEGLLDETGIRQLIRGADVVVDATHPYAVLVTENIRRAAEQEGVRRLRLVRDRSTAEAEGASGLIRYAQTAEEAAQAAAEYGGNVLLTTGSKDLPIYGEHLDPEHLFPRVLPLVSSIESCETAGIPHRNIIAVQGPFSQALNEAVLRDYHIDVMVTKESGAAGGFAEKIRACRTIGIPVIVIRRPEEEGLSYDQVLETCRELIK